MNRGVRFACALACVLLGCSAGFAQSAFNGTITPGVSTRSQVDQALGVPVKQDNATDFEYTPPAGAQNLLVRYDANGVVYFLTVMFSQPVSRDGMVQALGLPSQTQATTVVQGHLSEFFGAPAYVVFLYESGDASSGVAMLLYDSEASFMDGTPSGGSANATPAPAAPAVSTTVAPPVTPLPPPASSVTNNGIAPPAVWQRQVSANNQPWTVCQSMAPVALGSLGYAVDPIIDTHGMQRLFKGTGSGPNWAFISCTWVGTTAVTVITSWSTNGTSDAQDVANRLAAYMSSPAQANGAPAPQGQPAASGWLVFQRQRGVNNQSLSACTGIAQQALASVNYSVTAGPNSQGFETDSFGSGTGPSSTAIGCAEVGTTAYYSITSSSPPGTNDAQNVSLCLYSYIFTPGTPNPACNAAPATPSANAPPAPPAFTTTIAPAVTPSPTPVNNNAMTGLGMWQRQTTVLNQPWTVCANEAPTALASFGYGVDAVKDPRGNLRIFYSRVGGPNSAVITCSWIGTTALYTITSASVNGTSDAQNVANQLFTYMFSAPGNAAPAPPPEGQPAASGTPVLEQREQTVANQPLPACADAAQKALASLNYGVRVITDELGLQSIFVGAGSGSNSAIVACAWRAEAIVYTITGASVNGASDAHNVANCLYNFIFSPGTANPSCNAAAMQAPSAPNANVPAPSSMNPFSAPATPGADMAPTPAATVPAPLSSVLLPLSAMKGGSFTLKLLTPISSASSQVGDALSLQVVSNDPANGSMVTGAIDRVGCTAPGQSVCALDFSMDRMIYNGQSIPVVGFVMTLINSKGWPHVDEEGNVVTPGGNYRDAILTPSMAAINHTAMAPHPAVFTEFSSNGPTISFGAGSLFTVDFNSDLGWP